MKTSKTLKEFANELGITETELKTKMIEYGMLDEDGTPTYITATNKFFDDLEVNDLILEELETEEVEVEELDVECIDLETFSHTPLTDEQVTQFISELPKDDLMKLIQNIILPELKRQGLELSN